MHEGKKNKVDVIMDVLFCGTQVGFSSSYRTMSLE
jgi:hypothetical protein